MKITSKAYQRLVDKVAGKPEERVLSFLMLRSLKQAYYDPRNRGHAGLQLASYWSMFTELHWRPAHYDDREVGDGTALQRAGQLGWELYVETDPPAWEPVLMPVLPRETVEEKREEPRYQPELIHITGEMTGLKDPQLQALQRFASHRQYVNINMARLRRIDFVCAGNLANIIAALKGNGKIVRVLHANSLVTTLLRLLKVDENATLAGK